MKKSTLVKSMLCGLVISATLVTMPVSVLAAEVNVTDANPQSAGTIEPKADVIYYVYRDNNGQPQRRLWNATRGYWMSEWEDYNP